MNNVISVENMRRSDANTIASFVPSKELMWRASNGIYEETIKINPDAFSKRVVIAVGSGNNGGDGFGLALLLLSKGITNLEVISVSDHFSDDATYFKTKAEEMGLKTNAFVPGNSQFQKADTIVDCLLGTGFKGEVRGNYREAIVEINKSKAYVISADICSGLDGDTGLTNLAVEADLVVTIGYYKKGLLLARNTQYVRALALATIGIVLEKEEDYLLSSDEWEKMGFPLDLDYIVDESGVTYFREV